MLSRVFVFFICLALNFLHLEGKPKQVVILSYAEVDQYYNLNIAGKDRASKLPDYFKSLADQGYPLPEIIFGAKRSTDIPGNAVVRIDGYTVMHKNARILSFQPHMHIRGKRQCLELIYPTGGASAKTEMIAEREDAPEERGPGPKAARPWFRQPRRP